MRCKCGGYRGLPLRDTALLRVRAHLLTHRHPGRDPGSRAAGAIDACGPGYPPARGHDGEGGCLQKGTLRGAALLRVSARFMCLYSHHPHRFHPEEGRYRRIHHQHRHPGRDPGSRAAGAIDACGPGYPPARIWRGVLAERHPSRRCAPQHYHFLKINRPGTANGVCGVLSVNPTSNSQSRRLVQRGTATAANSCRAGR